MKLIRRTDCSLSGGSMANMTALLIAHRAKSDPKWAQRVLERQRPMTIYASDQIHMSIPKAADILGWAGTGADRDCDDRFRMNVALLRETLTMIFEAA